MQEGWVESTTVLLRKWERDCKQRKKAHYKAANSYGWRNKLLSIPVIIISTILGSLSFIDPSFLDQSNPCDNPRMLSARNLQVPSPSPTTSPTYECEWEKYNSDHFITESPYCDGSIVKFNNDYYKSTLSEVNELVCERGVNFVANTAYNQIAVASGITTQSEAEAWCVSRDEGHGIFYQKWVDGQIICMILGESPNNIVLHGQHLFGGVCISAGLLDNPIATYIKYCASEQKTEADIYDGNCGLITDCATACPDITGGYDVQTLGFYDCECCYERYTGCSWGACSGYSTSTGDASPDPVIIYDEEVSGEANNSENGGAETLPLVSGTNRIQGALKSPSVSDYYRVRATAGGATITAMHLTVAGDGSNGVKTAYLRFFDASDPNQFVGQTGGGLIASVPANAVSMLELPSSFSPSASGFSGWAHGQNDFIFMIAPGSSSGMMDNAYIIDIESVSSPAPSPTTTNTPPPPPTTPSPMQSPSTSSPSYAPSNPPTKIPTSYPTKAPTKIPTKVPTKVPTKSPTKNPTSSPLSSQTDTETSGENISYSRYIIGGFNMIVAILSALHTFLKFDALYDRHHQYSRHFGGLQVDIETLLSQPVSQRGDPSTTVENYKTKYSVLLNNAPDLPVILEQTCVENSPREIQLT